jgi:hypothetical protein
MCKTEFTIREPEVPWFNKILFSLLFAAFFSLILYIFKNNIKEILTSGDIKQVVVYLIILFGILIVFVLPIISRHCTHLNFSEIKIKHSYSIGPFTYNEKWQNLKDLNYISIFHTQNGYEVNLWYKKNQILNLFALEDINEVLEKAFFLSEQLNIDLLDARKRGYHKWINKSVYKEVGKIEYLD